MPSRSSAVRSSSERFAQWLPRILFVVLVALLFSPGAVGTRLVNRTLIAATVAKTLHYDWQESVNGSSVRSERISLPNLVMITDYSCAYCRRAEQMLDSLRESPSAVLAGYRFSLPTRSAVARLGVTLALCADERKLFAAVHDSLYVISSVDSPTEFQARTRALLTRVATNETVTNIEACMRHPTAFVQSRMNGDSVLTRKLRIAGTPAFLFRGRLVVGVQSVDSLRMLVQWSAR